MMISLIDSEIKNIFDFIRVVISSLKTKYIAISAGSMLLIQALANYSILYVDKEPLDIITLISLGGIFPGMLIVAFFCSLFVYVRYQKFHALIRAECIEISNYKTYFRKDLASTDIYGPHILCLTFNDKKVFYFISKKKHRTQELMNHLLGFTRTCPPVFHKSGRSLED
jgi:hypothetical protein